MFFQHKRNKKTNLFLKRKAQRRRKTLRAQKRRDVDRSRELDSGRRESESADKERE